MVKPSVASYSKTKSLVKKSLLQSGFTNIQITNGFYYFSGFATTNDKIIYFSISDTRHFNNDKILIRTAESYTDYSGGVNNYCGRNLESISALAGRLTR